MSSNSHKTDQWKHFLHSMPAKDFEQVLAHFNAVYGEDDIPVAWFPESYPAKPNLLGWMEDLSILTYSDFYSWSEKNRTDFWAKALRKLQTPFQKPYSSVLKTAPHPDQMQWLPDALFNPVENCFQAHASQTAIYFKTETQETFTSISYQDLFILVKQYARGFKDAGFNTSERIILYLPFSIEAVASYLAMIYAGIEPVLVADSFSSDELQKRMDISGAGTVLTTDHYWYADKKIDVLSKVLQAAPAKIILHAPGYSSALSIRQLPSDMLLSELKSDHLSETSHYYEASDTITILFSSGTTKEPKAIPWTALTPVKCATDGMLLQDIQEKDVVTWTSGMGWMMAPWLIFASLMNKATIAIYGGAATKKDFIDFTVQTGVTVLGTIPSVVKVWRAQQPGIIKDWRVRVFSSTGEPSEKEDYLYLMYMNGFKAPVIEYCGGTEIGGGYISSCVLLPNAPSYFNTPAPGGGFVLLSAEHTEVHEKEPGEVFIIPPSAGLSQRLLNKNHADEYYTGTPSVSPYPMLRKHGDGFSFIRYDGCTFYKSAGRTDDSMNLGGIKISSVELEEVFNLHPQVLESAAVSYQDKNGGPEKLVVFIRLSDPAASGEMLKTDLQKLLHKKLNPLFKISHLILKDSLPRTASNKIMRRTLRQEFTRHI